MRGSVGRWLIDYDPDATRRCFNQFPVGTGCDCNQCRNFTAAVGRTFPTEFLTLASILGVDPTKPAELCHYFRETSGLHLTGGWFHFVGSILSGEDAIQWSNGTGTNRLEELVPGLEFGLTGELAMVPEPFHGLHLVQLEFQTRVPWVLVEPEPDY